VVRVIGGLGNQLYEFGAGYALSKATGRVLLLDRSADPGSTGPHPRPFLLNELGDIAPVWNPEGWRRVVWRAMLSPKVPEFAKNLLRKVVRARVIGDNLPFNELCAELAGFDGFVVLSDYFQHAWAVNDVRDAIKSRLLGISLKPEGQAFLEEIERQPNPVAVHIRRGDYLSIPSAPTQSEKYYDEAIQRLRELEPGCHFFVFSDDHAWARQWAAQYGATLVDCHGENEPFGDLRLMVQCRHFILSSSTYSAWSWHLSVHDSTCLFVKPEGFDDRYGASNP